jgi:hypothetical protein
VATGAVGDSGVAARCSFLRVWAVLYPEAEVQSVNDDDNEAPAA